MSQDSVCASCGSGNPQGARFCGSCGSSLSAVCARCGTANPPAGSFCTGCGTALATSSLQADFASPENYTPPDLADKIRADRAAMLGERKQITVLFADVAGFTSMSEKLDPEDTRSIMQRCFEVMMKEVHRFEGTVSQFLGDGMLALFGAPIAHEDHAQRAIRAGLAIQAGLRELEAELATRGMDFRVRVGINSGIVVVGDVGYDLSMSYQAVGDTVNLAARMQTLAEPGHVVISDITAKLVEGYFVLKDLGAHTVKGKAEPVGVFEVVRPSRSRSRVDVYAERGLGPYVGRRAELDELSALFESAVSGQGRVALISGEAGLGKSRLIHEVRRSLQGVELTWITGRCISYGKDISYLPLVDLVKDAFGIEESDDEPKVASRLAEGVVAMDADPAHLPYLKLLLSIDTEADAIAADPKVRKSLLFDAFRAIVYAAAAVRPVVIVIEDLHWIDRLSTELLSYVAEGVSEHPLLMIFTHRPDWDPPFGDMPYLFRLELRSLSADESAQVAEAALGAQGLPPELRELIHRKAEGNPFYVEEVAKSLLEVGAIRRSNSHFVLAKPVEEIFVPDTVQGVIMARLDRLPEDPRRALQTASVIGREFTARLLDRTADLGTASEASLSELKSVQLIYERSLYPELAYMFKHALTHDVAYNSLLLQRRKVLHALVGGAIEELYSDRLSEHLEVLAHHYESAERWSQAFDYLRRSGEKSLASLSPQAAIDFLDRALVALDHEGVEATPEELMSLHYSRGQALDLMSDRNSSAEAYRQMLGVARTVGDQQQEAGALFSMALAFMWAHRFEESSSAAQEARELAERTGNTAIDAGSRLVLGLIRGVTGDLDTLAAMSEEAVTLAQQAGAAAIEGLALYAFGFWHHWRGYEPQAIEMLGRAIRVGRDNQMAEVLLSALWNQSLAFCGSGRYNEALSNLKENLDFSTKLGDKIFRCRTFNTLGWVYMDLCNWDLAVQANRLGLDESLVVGDPEIVRNAELNLADCALAAGDLDEAERLLEKVENDSKASGTWGEEWMKWRYSQHTSASLAELWLARADTGRAIAYADACITAAEATESKRNITKGHRVRAAAMLAGGDAAQAEAHIGLALRAAREVGNPTQLWKSLDVNGTVLQGLGRREEAAAAFAEAIQSIEQVAAELTDRALADTLLSSPAVASIRARFATAAGGET